MFGPADGMIKPGKNWCRISGLAPDTGSGEPITAHDKGKKISWGANNQHLSLTN